MKAVCPHLRRHRGFAAASALFAIGLFVLLGFVATSTSRTNAKAKMFHETKESMVAQNDFILNTLLLCRAVYPAGNTITPADPSVSHPQYPPTGDGTVANLSCPGQAPNVIWSSDSRALAPRTLPGFTPWSYINNPAVRISITTTTPGSEYYRDLLDAVVRKVGPTQAVRVGDTLTITLVN